MHSWGDGFEFFGEVGRAADEIGDFCRRWGRIQVRQTKEKYGTARVYCSFGLYSLHSITHPGHVWNRYPRWLRRIDYFVFANLFRVLRINKLVEPYQIWVYRLAYKRALTKYPMIRLEILNGADYTELLEPLYRRFQVECTWTRFNEKTQDFEKIF